MLKKLRNKLLLVNMLSLSAVILFSFTVIYFVTYNYMQGIIAENLRSIPPDVMTNAILSEREQLPERNAAEGLRVQGDTDLPMDYSKSFVINISKSGNILSVFSRIALTDEQYVKAARLARQTDAGKGRIRLAGARWQYIVTGENKESIVFLNVDDYEKALSRLLLSMIAIGVCVLAAVFLMSYRFANRAIRPVDESMEKQRRFVADASHELKTPLAIIDSNAEAILADGAATVDSQRKWIERTLEESNRMRALVDSLLYLAKAEDGARENPPFDLAAAAEAEIGRVEAVLYEQNIKLTLKKYADNVVVNADEERLRQTITILLDNAVKYTDADGEVTVEIGKGKHEGYIKVSNTGAAIPLEDLPRIFDRFYRADRARTSPAGHFAPDGETRPGGFGLGLAIAKAIVERSAGRIYAASANGTTSFTVELPLR
ncbi:MAG: HAMP domain-containing histidine kinase [Clostridiales Family XIII bacterium]|jgi:signal transduction histidine kinase|nr:HAMP domain-containing histidine kinase [Clostridiales Family XIII bacterium]